MSTGLNQSTGRPHSKPGVYKSDKEGHVLVLRWGPTAVTCITCAVLCSRADCKTLQEFEVKAKEFTVTHGYLGDFLADKIEDLLKTN